MRVLTPQIGLNSCQFPGARITSQFCFPIIYLESHGCDDDHDAAGVGLDQESVALVRLQVQDAVLVRDLERQADLESVRVTEGGGGGRGVRIRQVMRPRVQVICYS